MKEEEYVYSVDRLKDQRAEEQARLKTCLWYAVDSRGNRVQTFSTKQSANRFCREQNKSLPYEDWFGVIPDFEY